MTRIHEAARRGFERQADAYERGRPEYPPELTEWVVRALGLGHGRTAVDVGAGTGKLTRALLLSGADVVAVEPVAEMRAVLERELEGVCALDGTAESLPLDDAFADASLLDRRFTGSTRPRRSRSFTACCGTRGDWVWSGICGIAHRSCSVRSTRSRSRCAATRRRSPARPGGPRWRRARCLC